MRLLLLCLTLYSTVLRAECPEWVKEPSVPQCPARGMLGVEYPAIAHVLAQHANVEPEEQRILEMVRKILIYSKDKTPLLYLSVSDELMTKIERAVGAMEVSESTRKLFLGSLRRLTPRLTWVQDEFQSFVDPSTGSPQMRLVAAKGSQIETALEEMSQDCPLLQKGEPLRSFESKTANTACEFGGNIECVCRTGVCLRGENQKEGFARQFCSPGEELVVPAGWLKVGHVDEYVSTYPVPNTQCDVVVAIASYRKAVELLEKSPDVRLFDAMKGRERLMRGFSHFCEHFLKAKQSQSQDSVKRPSGGDHQGGSTSLRQEATSAVKCEDATQGDFFQYLKLHLDGENQKIQSEIYDPVAKQLIESTQSRLGPHCKVEVVELPQIVKSERDGKVSFFPNPTNSVSVGDNLLVPDPMNSSFRGYIRESLKEKGLGVSFVESDYLHGLEGNLHCATNSIRYCRGNGDKLPPTVFPTDDPTRVPSRLNMNDPIALHLFEGGTSEVRKLVLQALSRGGVGSASEEEKKLWAERITKHLSQRKEPVDKEVLELLLRLKSAGNDQITQLYQNSSTSQQAQLLNSLGGLPYAQSEFRTQSGAQLAGEALKSEDPGLVREALLYLNGTPVQEKTKYLPAIQALTAHNNIEIQGLALDSLIKLGRGVPLLDDVLRHEDPKIRARAVDILEKVTDLEQREKYLPGLSSDADARVRSHAYFLAAESPNALEYLQKAFNRGEEDTRRVLVAFQRAASPEIASKALIRGLGSTDPNVRSASERILGAVNFDTAAVFFKDAPEKMQARLIAHKSLSRDVIYNALLSGEPTILLSALERLKADGELAYHSVYQNRVLGALERLKLGSEERAAWEKALIGD